MDFILRVLKLIVWLASYPRSGNTLTRMILKNYFGLKSRTVMGSSWDKEFADKSDVSELIGSVNEATQGSELLDEARKSPEIFIIKTHYPPETDDKCIYVVRDGRAAVTSFWHYMNEIVKYETTLEQAVVGDIMFGSWSDHLLNWSPDTRKNTLLVKYENLVATPELEIKRISKFINTKVIKSVRPSIVQRIGQYFKILKPESDPLAFESLKEKYPHFFRAGNNEKNIQELAESGLEPLFQEKHAAMMARFGY